MENPEALLTMGHNPATCAATDGENVALASSLEDPRLHELLGRIGARLTNDPILQKDLMQESLLCFWKALREEPGHTRSWYLQKCRFHLQHWLQRGRSVDSTKRDHSDKRMSIEDDGSGAPLSEHHTNGELFETVSARDLISTLSIRLKPPERTMLHSLADGCVLREIATKLNVSYPTALKYRRNIATLTTRLGIHSQGERFARKKAVSQTRQE